MKNIVGKRFGLLVVLEKTAKRTNSGSIIWKCVCDCGNIHEVGSWNLQNGHSTSCGCHKKETSSRTFLKNFTKHGHSSTQTYNVWNNMMRRCNDHKNPAYENYGGRGITVCEEWKDIVNFIADMGERPKGMTLDRIDNNKGYFKDNCRWATKEQQANNKRNNHNINHLGETMSITQLAKKHGIERNKLSYRLNNGWSIEMALSKK